jgi:hypothetical protein
MADDAEAAALAAARSAPLADRAAHKLWRARCEAYDAMAEACRGGGPVDDEVGEHGGGRTNGDGESGPARQQSMELMLAP